MTRVLLLLAAGLTTVTVAACGGGTDTAAPSTAASTPSAGASSSAPSTQFNDWDVAFAQTMIPHHKQAVEMARLAATRAANPEVKSLATAIEAAQGPEISTLTGWLTAWGAQVPDDSMTGMDHGGMENGGMPGMMSAADMKNLEGLSGPAFDRRWMMMMIAHHQGAIQMAKSEQQKGSSPQAVALARKIQTDQAAEIGIMRSLLGQS